MRWSFATPDPVQVEKLGAEAGVSPILARLLALSSCLSSHTGSLPMTTQGKHVFEEVP